MPTGSFQQLAFDVQSQFEDQQGHSPPRGTRCRFRQEDRLEPFGEVCELHTIACRGLCKITFHFQTVSNHSRSDQCSYSRINMMPMVYSSALTSGFESCFPGFSPVLDLFVRQTHLRASETQIEILGFLEPTLQICVLVSIANC